MLDSGTSTAVFNHAPRIGALAMGASLLVSISGCAPTKADLQKKLHEQEREIARLSAERANLTAKSAALDDKVLVLEKKIDKCEMGGDKPRLEVVRLIPPDEIAPLPPTEIREPDLGPEEKVPKGARPVLSLDERTSRGWGAAPAAALDSTAFANLDPDNLGVVPGAGKGAGATSAGLDGFNQGYIAYSNKRYDEALARLAEFIKDNPDNDYADNALFWRGECYLATSKYMRAVGEFERLLKRYPKSEQVPSTLFRIGFAYDQLSDWERALEYYFKVVDNYPSSDAARRASVRVTAIKNRDGRVGSLLPTAAKR